METRLNRASALESRIDRNFLETQQTGGLEHRVGGKFFLSSIAMDGV